MPYVKPALTALSGTVMAIETRVSKTGNPWLKLALDCNGTVKNVSIIGPEKIAAVGALAQGSVVLLAGTYDRGRTSSSFIAESLAAADMTKADAAQAATVRTMVPAPANANVAPAGAVTTETKKDPVYPFIGTVSGMTVGMTKAATPQPYARFRLAHTTKDGKTAEHTAMAFGGIYEQVKADLVNGNSVRLLGVYQTVNGSGADKGGQSIRIIKKLPEQASRAA